MLGLTLGHVYTFVVGYAALVISLYILSYAVPKLGFVARLLAAYVSLIFSSTVGVVASPLLTLVGEKGMSQWLVGRSFKYAMSLTTGVTFEVDDPKDILGTVRPAVFVGNHQTELDVLMLGCMFPKYCSVTAKASLAKTPFLGWFMTLSGSIFLDRQDSKGARSVMNSAVTAIQTKRQSVYMFPEGTRSYAKDPVLLPFKKGAFHLAVDAGVPIVPCVVANYSHILWIKGMLFNSGKIPVKVLDPIPTKGLTSADVNELVRTTRELMLEELITLTAKVQNRPIEELRAASVAFDKAHAVPKASAVASSSKSS